MAERITTPEKRKLLEVVSYGLALIALALFVYHVLAPFYGWQETSDKAFYWFLFALLAALVPYIREITFRDFKLILDDLQKANLRLMEAKTALDVAREKFDPTREELILGYQKCLEGLEAPERLKRIRHLTGLYLGAMALQPGELKEMLAKVHYFDKKPNNDIDKDLIDAIKRFQTDCHLIADGVFGYQTQIKLLELVNKLSG